jgi:hypothetical protein
MSSVYQQLADSKKSEIQSKVDQVHEISEKVDALDVEIKHHHESIREKNQLRSDLSRKALQILEEIAQ